MSTATYRTQTAFSEAIKVSKQALSKHLSRVDWPVARVPPWTAHDLKIVTAWRRTLRADRSGGTGPFSLTKGEADTAWARERAELARLNRLEREGQLHDVAACSALRVRQVHAVKRAMYDLARESAPVLVGMDADAIEQELTRRADAICDEFSRGGT